MRLLFPARGFPTANGRGASFLVTMLEVSSKSSVLLLCLAIITLNINTVVQLHSDRESLIDIRR